jgi:DNA polymerase-3 subunit epsilon/CBS domain-containing protein
MVFSNATPLIALDAIVIDTETTGLDPADARIVEVGAVRIQGGRILDGAYGHLVHPGIPIPKASTAIHHIDDNKVAGAPAFAEIWPELRNLIGDSIVIGHTIGFDLAVLKRECQRAGHVFDQPRVLDTRLLAEIVEPALADYTIESLAAWLGVDVTRRHSAAGDALVTARIFSALVPKLREGGIRTLAEATRACSSLTKVLDEQHRAGWADTSKSPSRRDIERTLGRIDSYPYRHRVRDVMRAPAKFVDSNTPLGQAIKKMTDERVSSVFVQPAGNAAADVRPGNVGIVTERDALRAIASQGVEALDRPARDIMTRPLVVVPADAFIYRAIGRMSRLAIRHLGVVDEGGHVIGALSARDLLRLRASEAVSLGDEIDEAHDAGLLAAAWAKLPHVTASLIAESVNARDIAAVISRELGAATRQAAVIAEKRMKEEGHGGPPCAYAVAVLGSAGRGESLLAMDQDNALVFKDGQPGSAEDIWFGKLGSHIADILHEIGVPYCKGGVMAKNPGWRGSISTWRERIKQWITIANPEQLLSVDIFFDMRPVHGDGRLCLQIWKEAFAVARHNFGFAKLLTENAGTIASGLGLFGQFNTTNGRINLKDVGLFGIVSTARALAVCHHVVERSTSARLSVLKALGKGGAHDLDAMIRAQDTFLSLLLVQQIEDIDHGTPPSNAVAIRGLAPEKRSELRSALKSIGHLDDLKRDLLFRG